MSVRIEIGKAATDCKLFVDGRDILSDIGASEIRVGAKVTAGELTTVTIQLVGCEVLADIAPEKVITAMRAEADRLETLVTN